MPDDKDSAPAEHDYGFGTHAEAVSAGFVKHARSSSYSRSSNFVDCSCGWYLATDGSAYGEWAVSKWTEHVIDAMQDALVALSTEDTDADS